MTTSRCELMSSHWCSDEVTTLPDIQSLLTRDLEVRSTGSSGRRLLERLEEYCLDPLGATRPLGFALRLQNDGPGVRQTLEGLLEWTAQVPEFRLVALVALAPRLDGVAERLGRGRPSADTLSEVLAQASQALVWTHELVEGERADFVLREARLRTRVEQRRMVRHSVATDPMPLDFDRAVDEPDLAVALEVGSKLRRAVRARAISEAESRLIEATRTGERSLEEIARETDCRYGALRMRRARAETRLRSFYGLEGVDE